MPRNIDLLLIGAGPMAVSYADVLLEKKISFDVIGRGESSAKQFEEKTFIKPKLGLEKYLEENQIPSAAIIAVGIEMLAACTQVLLRAGIKNILLEKPGGLNTAEINLIGGLSKEKNARVLVAYNRRYYASVEKARQLIEADGGLRDVYFEFTEWPRIIEASNKLPAVKKKWFLANSTHVVDLAFHFAGLPAEWFHMTRGGNSWHPSATQFTGSGITDKKIIFSYHADWESAGRWGVELLTFRRRLFLRPMEQLFEQKINSVQIDPVTIDDELDRRFKPGLYKQMTAFLEGNDQLACSMQDQVDYFPYYNCMAGYSD